MQARKAGCVTQSSCPGQAETKRGLTLRSKDHPPASPSACWFLFLETRGPRNLGRRGNRLPPLSETQEARSPASSLPPRTQEPRLHPHGALPVPGPPHQLPGPGVPLSGSEHEFLVCSPGAQVFISLRPLAQQGSSLSSRLHPCDAELLHPGRPVGPDLHGLSGHVLHPFAVCPRTRPHCLHLHGLCWSPVPDSGHDGLHH